MAGGHLISKQPNWTQKDTPAVATKASAVRPAEPGTRHVCDSITATIACDSTAQTPLTISLKDGSTVIWAMTAAAPANGMGGVCETGFEIVGSVNTDLTLEFSGAGVTGSVQAVTLGGHSLS